MLQKIFDNDLVAKRKTKVTLVLNKRAYVGIVDGICVQQISVSIDAEAPL